MNTTLNSLFPQLENLRTTLDPFTVGYDKLFGDISDMTKDLAKKVTYPPYNIKQVNKNKYVIEMAVAGFAKSDIEITMDGNKLSIKGAAKDHEGENYLYQGIANRAFERTFTVNDKVEIKDAESIVSVDGSRQVLGGANINSESRVGGISTNDVEMENAGSPEMIFRIGAEYASSVTNTNYTSQMLYRNVGSTGNLPTSFQITLPGNGALTHRSTPGQQVSASNVRQNYTIIVVDRGKIGRASCRERV